MKGKIDIDGFLYFERAGVLKLQYCPYNTMNRCGDHCPRFEDQIDNSQYNEENNIDIARELRTCSGYIAFTEFVDERIVVEK